MGPDEIIKAVEMRVDGKRVELKNIASLNIKGQWVTIRGEWYQALRIKLPRLSIIKLKLFMYCSWYRKLFGLFFGKKA